MQKLISIKSVFVMLAFVMLASPLQSVQASVQSAGTTSNNSIIPIEVEPVCSDAVSGQAHWKVTNKNPSNVNINWTNLYNSVSGDYMAAAGVSKMLTSYAHEDANNTTRFVSGPDTNQTNATKTACQPSVPVEPTPVDCIDGKIQQNLVINWVSDDTVLVNSRDNKQLCEDVEIYFSSYIMPSDYNGQGFENNPTAYPQQGFSSVHATLHKNAAVNELMHIELPDSCENVQVDVYYGPEIETVGPQGHGTQNIESRIYESTEDCEEAPDNGGGLGNGITPAPAPMQPAGNGGQGTVTLAPQATVSSAPVARMQLPEELPKTGNGLLAALTVPIILATFTYLAALEHQRRRLRLY